MSEGKGDEMRFLIMIYVDEQEENRYGEAEWNRLDRGYEAFAAEVARRGFILEGGALDPPSRATTLKVRNGAPVTTDGPFAETKEQIGGFFLLTCPSLADAMDVARLMPGAQDHGVEIRAQR